MHFFALDVETANADRSSICSIGFVEFRDGVPVREWYSLVDPQQHFDPMNVSIHGLTERDVKGAPTFREVSPFLAETLNGQVVFSHMPFDRTAITAACDRSRVADLTCVWADSAKLARRAWAQCKSSGYGLKDVCALIGFRFTHHNALEDAMACGQVVQAIAKRTGFDMAGLLDLQSRPLSGKKAWTPPQDYVEPQYQEPPEDGLLELVEAGLVFIGEPRKRPKVVYEHPVVVFTGQMSLLREDMEALAVRNGYVVHPRVTKDTTHLVVGDEDWDAGTQSGKRKRAEDYKAKGQDIRIMSEAEFRVLALGLSEKEAVPDIVASEEDTVEVWTFDLTGGVVISREAR